MLSAHRSPRALNRVRGKYRRNRIPWYTKGGLALVICALVGCFYAWLLGISAESPATVVPQKPAESAQAAVPVSVPTEVEGRDAEGSSRVLAAQVEVLSAKQSVGASFADVSVRDLAGQPIGGLVREDFDVFSKTSRAHCLSVTPITKAAEVMQVGVLFDHSGSMAPVFGEAKEAAQGFVRALGPARIRMWGFADEVQAISAWTSDPKELKAALDKLKAEGGTALADAISLAAGEMRSMQGARAVVLFTDGTDSSKSQEEVLKRCDARLPIHVVGLKSENSNPKVLQQIAQRTGGKFYWVEDVRDLQGHFEQLASLLRPFDAYRLVWVERLEEPVSIRVGAGPAVSIVLGR